MKRILALLLTLAALGAHAQFQIWTKSGGTATSIAPSAYPLLAPDGTAAAPSYSFSAATGSGMVRNTANDRLIFTSGGNEDFGGVANFLIMPVGGSLTWSNGTVATGVGDLLLNRDAANVLALKNGANGQEFRVYGTTTGPKYVLLRHDGSNASLDTAASSGALILGQSGASFMQIGSTSHATGVQVKVLQQTVPTITTNGGTSPSCTGSDTAMTCTEGTSPPVAATFTVTFNGTWASAPSCVAMRGTTGASPLVQGVVTSTTTVVVNLSANLVASEKYHIHCFGVS